MSEEKTKERPNYYNFTEEISSEQDSESTSKQKLPSMYKLQLKLLLWKQYLVFKRNLKSTLFQILTPLAVCLYLLLIQFTANYVFDHMITKNPDTIDLWKIPKCYGNDCITLGIGLTNGENELSDYVINYISKKNNLKIGKDIKILAKNDPMQLFDYIDKHDNQTQTAVILCTGPFTLPPNRFYNGTFDCLGSSENYTVNMYDIVFNSSSLVSMLISEMNSPMPVNYPAIAVKSALDEALISYHSKNKTIDIKISTQGYPEPKSRHSNHVSIIKNSGPFYFFIPPIVTFVVVLIELVREKEFHLRNGLSMMGMSHSPYWHSWFITALVFTVFTSNSLIISGKLCNFDLFLNTPYLILLMMFGFFSISMICLAFLLSTFLKTTKSAYAASYVFILVGLVFQLLLSDINIIYALWSEEAPDWVATVRAIFTLYPPFNFSKCFGDIARKASQHYSHWEHKHVPGENYSWNRFVSRNRGNIPSALESLLFLLADSVLLCVLAWYFDHVLPSNRGSADPVYFFLTPKYWGLNKKVQKIQSTTEDTNEEVADSVSFEKRKVIDLEDSSSSIRILGIHKIFQKKLYKTSEDIHAVNNLYLHAKKGELLALLGHNGAGKSTLINMLTGLCKPTSGSAKICGFDIKENMEEIRKVLGVCPQHDILWDELTAKEHLILFGRLKGESYDKVYEEVNERLKEVNLSDEADLLAGTFSGGMKRRLSLAISGIGDPKVIILDEPTTGMDPINRRQAWKFIRKLKEKRIMILTTHSMEEADVLSDRVCVIVDGKLKCIGTSLYLKNQFGDGYRVNIISKEVERVVPIVRIVMPSAKIIDSSGGSLVLGISVKAVKEIGEFVRIMEGEEIGELSILKDLIEDWGLSHTTLEEVFMIVTGKKTNSIK